MKYLFTLIYLAVFTATSYSQNTSFHPRGWIDLPCTGLTKGGLTFINSTEDYYQLLDKHCTISKLKQMDIHDIDFSQNTIIGIHYSFSGCEMDIGEDLNISAPDSLNQQTIFLTYYEVGDCKPSFYKTSWYVVEKLPDSNKIKLVTERRKEE